MSAKLNVSFELIYLLLKSNSVIRVKFFEKQNGKNFLRCVTSFGEFKRFEPTAEANECSTYVSKSAASGCRTGNK